ncbi:hypothetical protein Godav_025076 [Gossypium davidsonii]|uniref:Uncharacterized protein n=1 Tax=Gossypium davidsonii TaxID=34287 RepID=A0A7J8TE29_GOSDV|nr:hypothetical protein [Gossypium davidsonii]MBA0636395.1 hypothetical protein [Gossypium davidsonii]
MRDRKRGRRGALLFTNRHHHHRMGFKQLRRWSCKHFHSHYSIKVAHRPNTDNKIPY